MPEQLTQSPYTPTPVGLINLILPYVRVNFKSGICLDLQNACSVAFVLTEALHLNGSDAATYAGAMSLLSDAVFQVEKNVDELICSAKRC